jgi:hypothetical protein
MSEESAIIVAYAIVVFAPFAIATLVFLDYLKTINHVYKRRPDRSD